MADPDPANRAAMLDRARAAAEASVWPQGELLGLPMTAKATAVRIKRAQAGRPPGAKNKRREDVARFILENIGDPLIVQAQLAVMPADELAAAAGCSVMDALVEKRLAAATVLPFLHSRQPLAVDLRNHRIVHLHIDAAPGGDANRAGVTLDMEVAEVVENQEVDDAADPAV